jgi:hypothetical protein
MKLNKQSRQKEQRRKGLPERVGKVIFQPARGASPYFTESCFSG